MALKASFRPQIERVNNLGRLSGTWRQWQLPGGQTAKVRADYNVQSLRHGDGGHGSTLSIHNHRDTQQQHLCVSEQLWRSDESKRLDAVFLAESCSVILRLTRAQSRTE
jgi:hypothetical protein